MDIEIQVVHDLSMPDFPTERVKLMPEYSCDMPLWCDEGDWQDLNLPTDLVARLAAWQAQFDANFRWDAGWLNSDVREFWIRQSEVLVGDLRRCLPTDVTFEVDLWPIATEQPRWKLRRRKE